MASEPSVSPADTPDYEAIRLRAQSQLSHFGTGAGTGVPSCDRCGRPTNRWDEPCAPASPAAVLAEDVLALLAVGERDKAERDLYKRQLDAVDKNLPWEDEPGGIGVVGRVQAILNLKADRERGERDKAEQDAAITAAAALTIEIDDAYAAFVALMAEYLASQGSDGDPETQAHQWLDFWREKHPSKPSRGERDRRQIAQLTEAAQDLLNALDDLTPRFLSNWVNRAITALAAVLADSEGAE